MPWWPGSPGPPWPCRPGWTTIRAGAWGRVLLGLVLSVALGWWVGGLCPPVCWSACTPPSPSAAGANWPGRALWPSSTGPRTGRNFWASFSWAPRWPRGAVWAKPSPCPAGLCCSVPPVMALGTAMGGRRIIETVGRDMVILAPQEGLAADLGGGTLPAPVYAGRPSSEHHSRQDRRPFSGAGLRRRGDGQPPCGCPHRPHLAVHLSRLRPAGVFVGQPLPFPPLLWYTDARYDFLTFDTGGSNHVPLRHSHL